MNGPEKNAYKANRDAALEAGDTHYHGKPCPRGHGTKRFVTSFKCVVCRVDDNRADRHRNPLRDRVLRYGLRPDEYRALLAQQDFRCAVCRHELVDAVAQSALDAPNVDHCHDSGQIRGILCHPCNLGIGHLKNDPDRLRAAAIYLENYELRGPHDRKEVCR